MKVSKELESLIDDALADAKITLKERKILIRKAEQEGIQKDEFELYLEARLYKEKVYAGKDGNIFVRIGRFYHTLRENNIERIMPTIGVLGSIIILLFWVWAFKSCNSYFNSSTKTTSSDVVLVDEYIAKNKFQEALEAASKSYDPNRNTLKVINAEFIYWLNAKDLDRALIKINEIKKITTDDQFDLAQKELNKVVYENYLDLIKAYCTSGQIETAKSYILEMPEKLIINEESKWIGINLGSAKVDDARKMYNAVKKSLKPNQEIEHFKESHLDEYKITTNGYPREDAMKIINDFEKQIK